MQTLADQEEEEEKAAARQPLYVSGWQPPAPGERIYLKDRAGEDAFREMIMSAALFASNWEKLMVHEERSEKILGEISARYARKSPAG